MATTQRNSSHKPPPSGSNGRSHVSPLGGSYLPGGGQILRGGPSAGGPVIKSPLKYRPREEPIVGKKGNVVDLV